MVPRWRHRYHKRKSRKLDGAIPDPMGASCSRIGECPRYGAKPMHPLTRFDPNPRLTQSA